MHCLHRRQSASSSGRGTAHCWMHPAAQYQLHRSCSSTKKGVEQLLKRQQWCHWRQPASQHAAEGSDADVLRRLCCTIDCSLYELAVCNQGRAAAAPLLDFVRAASAAFAVRCSAEKLLMMLEHNPTDWSSGSPGLALSASDKRMRRKWIDVIYATLQLLAVRADGVDALRHVAPLRHWDEDRDGWLLNVVQRTVEGHVSGEDASLVKLDRALATGGASGGVAAERRVLPMQFIPITQLVLLSMKVREEGKAGL